jgi:hypothetical protein
MQSIREIQNQRSSLANEVNLNRQVLERLETIAKTASADSRNPITVEIQKLSQAIAVVEGKIEAIDFCIGTRLPLDKGVVVAELTRVAAPVTKAVGTTRHIPKMIRRADGTVNIQKTIRGIIDKYYRKSNMHVSDDEICAMFRNEGVYAVRGTPVRNLIRVAMTNLTIGRNAILRKYVPVGETLNQYFTI